MTGVRDTCNSVVAEWGSNMEVLFALLHIAGAAIATIVIGIGLNFAWKAFASRVEREAVEDAALALGVPASVISDEANRARLVQYSSSKFSSDLFRNRLSDSLEAVFKVWSWTAIAVQMVVALLVLYKTFFVDLSNAPYIWFIVPIELLSPAVGAVTNLLCRLFTGRYIGQARRARAALAQLLEVQSVSATANFSSE